MERVRAATKDELEGVRLSLSKQLSAAPPFAARLRAQHLLAATLIRLGNPLDAETLLAEALADHADELARRPAGEPAATELAEAAPPEVGVDLQFLLGVCQQKTGRSADALASFDAVLEATEGEHWRARFHLALLSIDQGFLAEAEDMLQGVLARQPGHADAARILAMLVERRRAEACELVPPRDEGGTDVRGATTWVPP